jgi:WD40 repeat protein
MWKASSGEAVREFRGHTDLVSALDCVPGGDQFVSSSFDASLILWNMQNGKLIRQFGKASNTIVEASQAQTGQEQLNGHSTWIRAVVALPDGKRAVSAGNDRELFFWDLDTGTFVSRLVGHAAAVIALTLSPNGQLVASLGADNEIIVWDVEKRRLLRRSKHPSKEFPALAISPDSRLLALGDDAGIVRFVDLESGEERSKFETGGVGVTSLAFTPELEGTEIVAGCADGTIRIWPLRGAAN